MKRTTFLALIYIITGFFLTAYAYGNSTAKDILTPDERLWLNKNQSRIVYAVETNYAPFVFIDSNEQPAGLAYDYIRLVESKLGVNFKERRFSSLADIFSKVHSKEIDIVNAVTVTPERSVFLLFTDSFISVPNVIVVNKERQRWMEEKDLFGLSVSLVKSYAVTEYLMKKNLAITPDLASNDLEALLNVSFGKSDAAVVDLATASYLISKNGITNLRVAGEIEFNINLSMATSIEEPVLRSILQKGLGAITDEQRQEIRNRWINASTQTVFNDWRFWAIVGVVLLISLVIIIWNRSLNYHVKLRTKAEQEEINKLSKVIEQIDDIVAITDKLGTITYVNQAFCVHTGYTREEVIGQSFRILKSDHYDSEFYKKLWRMILGGNIFRETIINRKKNGDLYYENKTITPLKDDKNEIIGFVSTGKDVTADALMNQEMQRIATIDQLTGIYNRHKFEELFTLEAERSRRFSQPLSLIMIDIDHFKAVNDTYGHDVGDEVLKTLTDIVYENIRKIDIFARWGGEEFLVLSPSTDLENIQILAEKLRLAVENTLFPKVNHITISLGVSTFREDDTFSDLFKRVDQGLYYAKEQGRNQVGSI
ncbi:MAG: diguanylate cyclase [Campylobacterales bacterium]|nr:diguanylate cyclase [Campylobacterales bacterium]